MEHLMTWIMPALDASAITLLGALLWRLRRDPAAAWHAHEARLRELFESLRVLAAQSEGVARDLDGALGAHERRLRALLTDATEAVHRIVEPARDDVVARVRSLAAAATPIEEIARRVDMPIAEVRVLVGIHAERNAKHAPAARNGRHTDEVRA